MKITEKNLGRNIVRDIVIIILLLLFFVVIPVTINRIRVYKAKCEFEKAKEELSSSLKSLEEQLKKSQKAVQEGKIVMGMTDWQVRKVYGAPQMINKTVTANGISEQWVYGKQFLYRSKGILDGKEYLYFKDGILSSWQEKPG